ncbi:MAG: urocanate hydratase [Candidatus Lokiarchaeota archaeon]|nr:urocanate hydratase [Candidatus Lokiarchaeota archaeon]
MVDSISLRDLKLPPDPVFDKTIRRSPSRGYNLSASDTILAVKNALRYIPAKYHEILAPELLMELIDKGRIYGYRYRPQGEIKAKPIDQYKGIVEAKAIQLMIDNNLDFDVALYPYELVTYGESGQVCQNWMQYRLIKKYLEKMTDTQTLVVMSGHPLGIFPSKKDTPRVVSTNGLMVGMYDTADGKDFHRAQAIGVANYGQMTAGGWMYIGPQGIVHGTYITLLNAGRIYLGNSTEQDLAEKTYLSSGLGGMSGAQAKAVEIAGGIGILAEVDKSRIDTRYSQGWLSKWSDDLGEIFQWVSEYQTHNKPVSIGYYGNVVDLWQYVVDNKISIDLASDQTSCHAVYEGGYTPDGLSFKEGRELIKTDREKFKKLVDESLTKQYRLILEMTKRGTYFWDYGNSFLKAVYDAGVQEIAVGNDPRNGFVFPSYVEELVGPVIFDYGYGPFRWVVTSLNPEDLRKTDRIAMECIDPKRRGQDRDNWVWIRDAEKNNLVVGSQARILYADAQNRVKIALEFNKAIREGRISRPIMLGRDHHDTGGTDSPFRETSNILDGSNIMSDMAHHCWAGNAARGMTMCVLSNGGGVGSGKVINGGFGLVLDGSERVDSIIKSALDWDVNVGVARRAWARNPNALETAKRYNSEKGKTGNITLPEIPKVGLVEDLIKKKLKN